jgi:uncharacterized protein (DUF1800 family)
VSPSTAREALIVEAIGDVAQLLQRVDALKAALDERCESLLQASAAFENQVMAFDRQIAATTQNVKTQTVKYMAAQTADASKRSIEHQSQALADAARVAFGAELGATMQRLQMTLRPLLEKRDRWWESWLTHATVAVASATATWALLVYVWPH